jgi:hypothetical protein
MWAAALVFSTHIVGVFAFFLPFFVAMLAVIVAATSFLLSTFDRIVVVVCVGATVAIVALAALLSGISYTEIGLGGY